MHGGYSDRRSGNETLHPFSYSLPHVHTFFCLFFVFTVGHWSCQTGDWLHCLHVCGDEINYNTIHVK